MSLVNLPDNQPAEKNESITTVVLGDGFHVHKWSAGKKPGKLLKVTLTVKGFLALMRGNTQTPTRENQRSRALVYMSDLFVCCRLLLCML